MDAQKGFAAAMRCAKTLPMAQENQRRRDNARESAADGAARLQLIETAGFPDYALLDSGGGRKLERFGPIVVDRPEPQALWTPAAPEREWRHAHAVFLSLIHI